jgi:hypothetical protein
MFMDSVQLVYAICNCRWANPLLRYYVCMAFSMRCTANARYEIKDDVRKELLALALGRKNAELIIEALNARFGAGDQLELDMDDVA